MSRSVPPLVLALTLVSGMLLGVLLDRRGTIVSAQEGASSRNAVASASGSGSTTASGRATSEDALYQKLDRQYSQFESVNKTFELVSRAVSPAVVHIVATKTGGREDIPRGRTFEESGSGVIVRADGSKGLYVLTNNHVVEGSKPARILINLHDGRAIHPDQVWFDPMADIAVLSLNRDDLAAARFGNSDDMAVGSWVLAMGSPFGLTHSVSQGIISARSRHMDDEVLADVKNQDFLQTDAAINPGNSGGPLVNMKGEVIGINNSIASNSGGYEGVGFSIPSNIARWIMNDLIKKGRVSRGALGIDLRPKFQAEDAVRLGLDRPQGAWVGQVYPASPASVAGLRDGDVILRFQDVDVTDLNHLINLVSMTPIGQTADLIIWREKRRYTLRVTVGDQKFVSTLFPDPNVAERTASRGGGLLKRPARPETDSVSALGVQFQTMDETLSRRLELPSSLRGAVVLKLEPTSPLASLLQPLDVIHTVDGRVIATAQDAAKAIGSHSDVQDLQLGYDRVVRGKIERRSTRVP
jgi:serine protease Do